MNIEEARAWLRGERSMCNIIPQDPFETWEVRIRQADAAMTERAYWIARSYSEGIVGESNREFIERMKG
jgi:hypothetical protein